MTYSDQSVMQFEPTLNETVSIDDPFVRLDGIADDEDADHISNEQMDAVIYEK